MWLVLLCLKFHASIAANNDEGALDVAAFNVQVFGETKMKNPVVRKYLKEIILRYDLILIQEIRDSSGKAIIELMSDVKEANENYEMKLSARLGRTSSKEQYAYIYRKDWLTPSDEFVYADPGDLYEREPYIVRFKSEKAAIKDFAVVGIHTSPDDAEAEISNLESVYDDIVKRWSLDNVILMGDFNAGCSYTKRWENIKLATDPRFYWLFDNTVDSTTKRTDCPYDRVVVAGKTLLSSIIPLSPAVFRFDEYYPLTQAEVEQISDHYPIHFQIRSDYEAKNIFTSKAVNVIDRKVTGLTANAIYAMRKKAALDGAYRLFHSYTRRGAYLKITVWKKLLSYDNVVKSLYGNFHKDFPNLITFNEIHAAVRVLHEIDPLRYLPRGHGLFKTLYDYWKGYQQRCAIIFECSLEDRSNPTCQLQIKHL